MNIYIDCEFNGFGGELISMAMVDETGLAFYEVLPCLNPTPWINENVMPVLNKAAIGVDEFQVKMRQYLHAYQTIHIVADWPEDIMHFCKMTITGFGTMMTLPHTTFEIVRNLTPVAAIAHNALSDAEALKDAAIEAKRKCAIV